MFPEFTVIRNYLDWLKDVWRKNNTLDFFYRLVKRKRKAFNKNHLILNNYFDWVIRKFINPRYRREGDIHVFPDDHIEWDKIIEVVEKKSNVSSITWTLNRMNGDIETFLQSSEADVFNKVRNGEYKVRRYGNCQKFKNNVL